MEYDGRTCLNFVFLYWYIYKVDEEPQNRETLELAAPKFDGKSFVWKKGSTFVYEIKRYV